MSNVRICIGLLFLFLIESVPTQNQGYWDTLALYPLKDQRFDNGYQIDEEALRTHVMDTLHISSDPITALYNNSLTHSAVTNFFAEEVGDRYISDTILRYAEKKGLPFLYVFALVYVESGFRPQVVNNNGSSSDYGLFQINSKTFRHISHEDKLHIETNINAGTDYLTYAFSLDPDPGIALAIYNAGPARPLRGRIPDSTVQYVEKIETQVVVLQRRFIAYMSRLFETREAIASN